MHFEQTQNKGVLSDQPFADTVLPIISDKHYFSYHGKL